MISEFFIDLSVNFIVWLAGVFGSYTPPDELLNAVDAVDGALAGISGVGVWVDWAVLGACTAAASATWAVVFGIRLVLRVASHIPIIGGAG
jgi:hypothetical protein